MRAPGLATAIVAALCLGYCLAAGLFGPSLWWWMRITEIALGGAGGIRLLAVLRSLWRGEENRVRVNGVVTVALFAVMPVYAFGFCRALLAVRYWPQWAVLGVITVFTVPPPAFVITRDHCRKARRP